MFMRIRFLAWLLTLAAVCALCYPAGPVRAVTAEDLKPRPGEAVATFAGGCFWRTEADFEKVPGVAHAISGGKEVNPTYMDNSAGKTSHLESVQVFFDPGKVRCKDLVEYFFRHINPTDPDGQFVDRGRQYRSAIFYHDEQQRQIAEESKKRLADSGVFKDKPIVTEIRPYEAFYPAEEYHQQYYKKNPLRYRCYRPGSGHDQFLKQVWGEEHATSEAEPVPPPKPFVKPSLEELKKKLTPMQFDVTQRGGTEQVSQ
jgi:peptide methionine sulfoxide reductase msrA/msrB